jgi:hypothetical protein
MEDVRFIYKYLECNDGFRKTNYALNEEEAQVWNDALNQRRIRGNIGSSMLGLPTLGTQLERMITLTFLVYMIRKGKGSVFNVRAIVSMFGSFC